MYLITEGSVFVHNGQQHELVSRSGKSAVCKNLETNLSVTIGEAECPQLFQRVLNG